MNTEEFMTSKATMVVAVWVLTFSLPASAGKWHKATAETQEAAMRAATAKAKQRASKKGTCYKPAWTKQVIATKPCNTTPAGIQCWATSADEYQTCSNGKHGWLRPSGGDGWALPALPIYPDLPSLPRPRPAPVCTPNDASQGRC